MIAEKVCPQAVLAGEGAHKAVQAGEVHHQALQAGEEGPQAGGHQGAGGGQAGD